MTFYQVDLETEKPGVGRYLANDADLVSYLKNRDVLVPVERCEHGNYAEHVVLGELDTDYRYSPEVCAGIGDNDE